MSIMVLLLYHNVLLQLTFLYVRTTRFLGFGDPTPYRPVEDLAFAVAIFYQRSGTFQNYYMVIKLTGREARLFPLLSFNFFDVINLLELVLFQYHGGTNFERTSGGPLISTSYDYDAPIDEYGKGFLPLSLYMYVFV